MDLSDVWIREIHSIASNREWIMMDATTDSNGSIERQCLALTKEEYQGIQEGKAIRR